MTLRGFDRVGGLREFPEAVKEFHGLAAPGVLIGGFMVDMAVESLPDRAAIQAIVETSTCLVDAVQLLTPCTVGNGRARIIDGGRLALTLYDGKTLEGVRVFLDARKLDGFSRIKKWFFGEPLEEQGSKELLQSEILEAGRRVLSMEQVTVRRTAATGPKARPRRICQRCGQPYRGRDPASCLFCRAPYYASKK